jgi:hypothetical protein
VSEHDLEGDRVLGNIATASDETACPDWVLIVLFSTLTHPPWK